jgi:hypothetical protein
MARAVNPHPAVLHHVLGIIPPKSGAIEIAEKRRRDPPHQLIESLWIGTLILRHQRPQLEVVNPSFIHLGSGALWSFGASLSGCRKLAARTHTPPSGRFSVRPASAPALSRFLQRVARPGPRTFPTKPTLRILTTISSLQPPKSHGTRYGPQEYNVQISRRRLSGKNFGGQGAFQKDRVTFDKPPAK